MKKLLALLALLPGLAFAQSVTDVLTWALPTAYEDGSAIGAGELTEVRVYVAGVTGGPYALVTTLPGTATTVSLPRQTPQGKLCYVVTVFAGLESAYSNEACKTVRKPKAPAVTTIK